MKETMAPSRAGWALPVLLLALGCWVVAPAEAARPPEGKTYFTLAMGLNEAYDIRAECFEFQPSRLCSLDGRICGTWSRDERRLKEAGFTFELSALDVDGLPVILEGRGRIDTRGPLSSIAGAGIFASEDAGRNISFAGREADPIDCLELLEASEDDDRMVVVGSGNPVTESRDVSDFTGVVLNGVGEIVIRHTGVDSLTITADDNIMPLLRSEVRGGRLLLTADPARPFRTRNKILYEITVRSLDEITISGVGAVDASGIDTEQLMVDVRGVSIVTVKGRVERQVVRVAGVSIYQARDLKSRQADVELEGVSEAVVRVSDLLKGRLTGFSKLEYIGNPRVDVFVAPGCTLRRID